MADDRKHRGMHPGDQQSFATSQHTVLLQASVHLSWLLSRGYAVKSSLKLVGDRFALTTRQRTAVQRSSCTDQSLQLRRDKRVSPPDCHGRSITVDGFNLLTTIETTLAGGVLLIGRDGCLRDMASMHGSYRKVAETLPALQVIGEAFANWEVSDVTWWFDKPVSNSGRLKKIVEEMAEKKGWSWSVQLHHDPDQVLATSDEIIVTADSIILDRCKRWLNAARSISEGLDHDAIIVDFTATDLL